MLRSRHRRSKMPQARVVPPHEAFPSQIRHACLYNSAVSADMSDMIVRTGQVDCLEDALEMRMQLSLAGDAYRCRNSPSPEHGSLGLGML
jgi:hypothetical protein